jgi:hypothetical protein
MAKIKLELDIPGWTADQLRQAVRDIDALDDECPIAVEFVQASDVMAYILDGQLGFVGSNGYSLDYIVNELS